LRRAPVVVFGVLVAATFAAFFVAQRLKNEPSVVQRFMANYVFSPNGDGRYDRSHITFRIKKADDVTVEILDADGDPVRTMLDDKHLDAYRPINPSLSWDGRDDDGQLVPDGRYRVRITLRHLGRSLIPQRSIVKDTTPPKPKVRSIGPSHDYGPELLPRQDGKPAHIRFEAAGYKPKIMIFKPAPGTPRLVFERALGKGVTTFDWDGTTDSGRRASPGTYLVVLQWRDFPGNIGSSVPLDRKTGLPILDRGKLPGRGGITVRYIGAQTPVTAVKARDTVDIKVDARQERYRWEVRPLGTSATRAKSTNPKTTPNVRFQAPGGKSRMYVFTAHTATKSTKVVFPVQARAAVGGTAAQPHGVLVVLPYTTWQGRNAVDDDGDGAPNTLDLGVPARAVRVWAGDGLPVGFADQEANVFRWLDGKGKRYDITTDLALLGGSGPRLTGHTGVLIPGDARWLPTKVRASLRAFVKAGGTVVSTGTDSLRRSVGFDAKTGRFVKPSVRRATDLFGMRIGALQTQTTNLTNFTNDPKLDLFAGADGVFHDVEAWEPTERTGEEADLLSDAVTDDANDPKTVVVAAGVGEGRGQPPGVPAFPSFARRIAEDSDPATSALMARMWTLLSR
jgi:hypothetical protein